MLKKDNCVLFDCGAEFRGKSLNTQLLHGPYLTSSLQGVLIWFKQKSIAVMADFQYIFQVKVAVEDRDFLRFLCWPGGDLKQEPVKYRITVHLFGAVSSPSRACYALRKHAEVNKNKFAAEARMIVLKDYHLQKSLLKWYANWQLFVIREASTWQNGLATTVEYCNPVERNRDQRFCMSWTEISCQLSEPLTFIGVSSLINSKNSPWLDVGFCQWLAQFMIHRDFLHHSHFQRSSYYRTCVWEAVDGMIRFLQQSSDSGSNG